MVLEVRVLVTLGVEAVVGREHKGSIFSLPGCCTELYCNKLYTLLQINFSSIKSSPKDYCNKTKQKPGTFLCIINNQSLNVLEKISHSK